MFMHNIIIKTKSGRVIHGKAFTEHSSIRREDAIRAAARSLENKPSAMSLKWLNDNIESLFKTTTEMDIIET